MDESDHVPHVEVIPFPLSPDRALTRSLCLCYAEVFAGHPWHEHLKCHSCGKYWGLLEESVPADGVCNKCSVNWSQEVQASIKRGTCPDCLVALAPYWPLDKVEADLKSDLDREAICYIARVDGAVSGFCWGFPISLPDLEVKLGLKVSPGLDGLCGSNDQIFYQDEIGVSVPHRGRPLYSGLSLAKAMFYMRHRDSVSRGMTVGVARVRQAPKPSVTYSWYTGKLGYRIVGRYPTEDGRVVIAQKLDAITPLVGSR